jgi:hypothetical protein
MLEEHHAKGVIRGASARSGLEERFAKVTASLEEHPPRADLRSVSLEDRFARGKKQINLSPSKS